MKATIDAKELARAVRTVAPFVARASGLSALTMVRLEAADGVLTATGSDLEYTCTTSAPCEVGEPDTIVAPAGFLARAVGVFDGTVEMTAADDELVLEGSGRHVEMRLGDAAMYPRLAWPEVEPTPLGDTWALMLSVLHAASLDPNRQILAGLHLGDGFAEATDSYRAAWTELPTELDALIPAEALRRAAKILGGDVSAWTGDRQFTVTDGATTIATRLIEGEYPNVRRLVCPTNAKVEVDSAIFLDALAAVSIVPDDAKEVAPVRLHRDGDRLRLARVGPDVGTCEASIDATFTGVWPEPYVAFQIPYLADAVKAAAVDSVAIEVPDNCKPALVVGGQLEQLMMPVKVQR